MERYRIEWKDGPRLVGGDTWVIDLDLLAAANSTTFRFAKKLQVVATYDDVAALGEARPGWTFWRAMVAVAVGTVIRRLSTDDLHLERPRLPVQIAPDVHEATSRASEMTTEPAAESELVSEFGTS
jgi:hypothetical protein